MIYEDSPFSHRVAPCEIDDTSSELVKFPVAYIGERDTAEYMFRSGTIQTVQLFQNPFPDNATEIPADPVRVRTVSGMPQIYRMLNFMQRYTPIDLLSEQNQSIRLAIWFMHYWLHPIPAMDEANLSEFKQYGYRIDWLRDAVNVHSPAYDERYQVEDYMLVGQYRVHSEFSNSPVYNVYHLLVDAYNSWMFSDLSSVRCHVDLLLNELLQYSPYDYAAAGSIVKTKLEDWLTQPVLISSNTDLNERAYSNLTEVLVTYQHFKS